MFNVFKFTDADLKDWLENKFNKFKPDYIYGYAGVIYDIAKFIKDKKIKLVPIKKIITTSERLEQRKFIESIFKCPVIDQYGCSEVITIAIDDQNQVMHSSDDFVLVEVNGNNEVLLTPIESYGMPLLRYKVGDVGWVRKTKKSQSKYPFKEFNIIIGRIYEFLINKNHEKISGGLIKQQVEDEDLSIREWQLVQKSIDQVELNIVYDEFTKQKSVKRLKQIIKDTLGCSKIKVKYMKSFPIEPNGKRIAFKCEIKD
jgi:phenylacetate-CoA ligase